MNFAQTVKAICAGYTPEQLRYIQAARDRWHRDGEIEIDDDAVISESCDEGVYVSAWVWVCDDELPDTQADSSTSSAIS